MLLDVKSVEKQFNGVYALKGLDFSLGEGEVHGHSSDALVDKKFFETRELEASHKRKQNRKY